MGAWCWSRGLEWFDDEALTGHGDHLSCDRGQLVDRFSDIGVGWGWLQDESRVTPAVCCRLHVPTESVDNAGHVSSVHIARFASVMGPGTERSDEAAFDQLQRVQRREESRGAPETLEAAHRSQSRLHTTMVSQRLVEISRL